MVRNPWLSIGAENKRDFETTHHRQRIRARWPFACIGSLDGLPDHGHLLRSRACRPGSTQPDWKGLARLQPARWNSVRSAGEGKNPSDDGAGGVTVSKRTHRVPQGLLETARRMGDDPETQRHGVRCRDTGAVTERLCRLDDRCIRWNVERFSHGVARVSPRYRISNLRNPGQPKRSGCSASLPGERRRRGHGDRPGTGQFNPAARWSLLRRAQSFPASISAAQTPSRAPAPRWRT
jgi:hypothetical protein